MSSQEYVVRKIGMTVLPNLIRVGKLDDNFLILDFGNQVSENEFEVAYSIALNKNQVNKLLSDCKKILE